MQSANSPVKSVSEQSAKGTCASPQINLQQRSAGVGHPVALAILHVVDVVGVGVEIVFVIVVELRLVIRDDDDE